MNAIINPRETGQAPNWEQELAEIGADIEREMENLVTEDDTPVDNILSEKQQCLLTEPLYGAWPGPALCTPGHRRFLALANVGLFYALREPPLVPDMMLALDVPGPGADLSLKANRSYFVWKQGGKPPVVAIEVVSNREAGEDSEKLRKYAIARVEYYVIFDPWRQLSNRVLRIYQLTGQGYLEQAGGLLQGVGLGLRLWQGEYEEMEALWLRWTDTTGRLIPTRTEQAEQERQRILTAEQYAEQERQRALNAESQAEQERQRTEQERQRANQAEQQVIQLMARLRENGHRTTEITNPFE
ncbi:MAG: Uma2 family endonuclease [Candidatus Competibacteraceae bacterium]|nr:Uma2 family endonuclease [Candidatus Competibacteraceae bacterium]MCP5126798.1 Uma2 family endonuclease [Gammaproteobacteria bacterium]